MEALTPARRRCVWPTRPGTSPCCRAGLSTSCAPPSKLSASNHLTTPAIALSPTLSVTGFPLPRVWASPFNRRLASRHGRIEFVFLRIARSPRVALHAASRPAQLPPASVRSVILGWTCTSLTKHSRGRTIAKAPPLLGVPGGEAAGRVSGQSPEHVDYVDYNLHLRLGTFRRWIIAPDSNRCSITARRGNGPCWSTGCRGR
jgi:hypothetical protein